MAKFGKFEIEFIRGIMPSTGELMGITLAKNIKFARDRFDNLYYYENGVYRDAAKDIFQCCIAIYDAYRGMAIGMAWTTAKDNQTIDYLVKTSPLLLDKPLEDRINLKNGLYFLKDNRFEPHSEVDHSDYYTTLQLPISYDPNATCPNITRFMQDVFPCGWEMLFDIIGVCMVPSSGQHKAVVLLGTGSNGKSIFLYGLREMIGRQNVSSVPIHMLADGKDKFANANLFGKLANASDDTASERIMDVANIKSIISGNPIRVEAKFKDAITFIPYCKLIFGTNHRLESNDNTAGYFRRIMHVPFQQTFEVNPKKERELQSYFKDPIEQSGALNEILKRLWETLQDGFIIPEEAKDLVENFDPIPGGVEQWLKNNLVEDPNGKIPVTMFYIWYNTSYDITQHVSQQLLSRYIRKLFPTVKSIRPRIDGRQLTHYGGIRFIDEEQDAKMREQVILPEDNEREAPEIMDRVN
jgi:P4 family phage/plasmid primase-like protien